MKNKFDMKFKMISKVAFSDISILLKENNIFERKKRTNIVITSLIHLHGINK